MFRLTAKPLGNENFHKGGFWKDREVLENGYLFNRMHWHTGYAAKACKEYAFEILETEEVCSSIRDTNTVPKRWRKETGCV